MNGCKRIRQYIEMQLRAVCENEDFLRHKWFRSEEACHDIGVRDALNSFAALPHYQDFARAFRKMYCNEICDMRNECQAWQRVRETEKITKPTAVHHPAA